MELPPPSTNDRELVPVEESFRAKARAFLLAHGISPTASSYEADEASPLGVGVRPSLSEAKRYQAALYDAGLAGITWPREYGGQGLSDRYQSIFNEEAISYASLEDIYGIGFGMCIPTILAHGSEANKHRYVRPAARGEEIWCQLFSEPAAGSDLASLRSTAVRDGARWILNGQKVWTSCARFSHLGMVLARTDPTQPKHKGLSMFVIDMHAPGVIVRPLRQMTGSAKFNEVFLDNVRIPSENMLGEQGKGWGVAMTTLMNERVAISTGRSTERFVPLDSISIHLDLARQRGLTSDPVIRQKLTDLVIRYWTLDMVGLRIRQTVAAGRVPGPEGSVGKLAGALLTRRSAELACELAGPKAIAWEAEDLEAKRPCNLMLLAPGQGIAGGTNEVMRNILGERVLGLPREPAVDRDIPFRDLP